MPRATPSKQTGCMTQNLSAGVPSPNDAASASQAVASHAADAPAKQNSRRASSAPKPSKRKPSSKKPSSAKLSKQQPDSSRPPAPRPARGHSSATIAQPLASPDDGRPAQRPIRIGSPTALLAAVPYLIEFEPANSMVVIGTEPPRAQVRVTLRYDLPNPPNAKMAADLADHAASVLVAQRIRTAVAVGYGAEHLVTPVADALRELAPLAGVTVTELLRVEDKRYWSYLCAAPGCCPPEGTPFDITNHPVAKAMASAGSARVLSSRAELAATVASVDGDAAETMRQETRKAEKHVARLLARVAHSSHPASARRLIVTAGLRAVAEAISRYRRGDSVGPQTAAWLTVVLRDLRVRDDAWSRMLPEYRKEHLRMWTDLTRLARPGYVPAPASLLAFVAWQSGNGALANVALDRALADDPKYSMAKLLRQAVDSGAPPSLARLPMTPEEVAASYDALEAENADGDANDGLNADAPGENKDENDTDALSTEVSRDDDGRE